ncbi:MAG: ABC transporter permease subunit [Ignavibacteriales bacterium]|nr:ABC transporter permease subunit [Ignavibacteriales bacterium]
MRSLGMFLFTIREAILRGTLIFYFVVATIVIAFFAFAIRVSPDDGKSLMILGNIIPSTLGKGITINPVEFVLLQFQKSSASFVVFFGIFAVAGLIPAMLEKGTVELFLSKPLSRTSLLLSRSLGATTGVILNMMYFVVGIWLIFGIKVGVWHWGFLLSTLVVALVFFLFFSIVALIGLITRSGGFSIMFSFIIYMLSGLLRYRTTSLYRLWDNTVFHRTLDSIYYAFPQVGEMLDNSALLIGTSPFDQLKSALVDQPSSPYLPFLYSFISATVIYALAIRYFSKEDF